MLLIKDKPGQDEEVEGDYFYRTPFSFCVHYSAVKRGRDGLSTGGYSLTSLKIDRGTKFNYFPLHFIKVIQGEEWKFFLG